MCFYFIILFIVVLTLSSVRYYVPFNYYKMLIKIKVFVNINDLKYYNKNIFQLLLLFVLPDNNGWRIQ